MSGVMVRCKEHDIDVAFFRGLTMEDIAHEENMELIEGEVIEDETGRKALICPIRKDGPIKEHESEVFEV